MSRVPPGKAGTAAATTRTGPAPLPTALRVAVKPRSRVAEFRQMDDGTWLARLKAPPVDGKANAELIALVAKHFGCAKSAVDIKTGAGSKLKRVVVPD